MYVCMYSKNMYVLHTACVVSCRSVCCTATRGKCLFVCFVCAAGVRDAVVLYCTYCAAYSGAGPEPISKLDVDK